jgi:hypothetical protein
MGLFLRIISVFVALLACCHATLAQDPIAQDPIAQDPLLDKPSLDKPSLVVILAVDQLRADRLTADLPGGLGRLVREGYVFEQATLDHGLTNTCPGHVVMSTGMNPTKTGIPGNNYIDHDTMGDRYCVDDSDAAFTVLGTSDIRSPNAITAETFGDWLKQQSQQSRVFSVSGKDRAAITLGGKSADGVFWYNRKAQGFTTSGYYAAELPDYVQQFNGKRFFEDGFGKQFPAAWAHGEGKSRKDDYIGESEMHSRTSTHHLNTGEYEERADQLYWSPYLDVATAALAKNIIDAEQLGQRGVTDFLAVSLSATDLVGHLYGPFSAEADDSLLRVDEVVGDFLTYLDETTDGNYILALSADHGVQALPEWLSDTGELTCPIEGGRIDAQDLVLNMYWNLYWEFTFPFGDPRDLIGFSAVGLTVNESYAKELGSSVDEVVASLEASSERTVGVKAAWTVSELQTSEDPFARLFRNSYVPGKSGHLITQFEETCLLWLFPEGTSHVSPYMYDRHIPLVFFGAQVRNERSSQARHSIDIAPTLGKRIGLTLPSDLDGKALDVWQPVADSDQAATE